MAKMYEPRDFDELAADNLFIITDYVEFASPHLVEVFKKQTPKQNICHRYSHGNCAHFAAVAHLILGCPVVEMTYGGKSYHYLVEIDEKLMDINGFVTKEHLEKEYDISPESKRKLKFVRTKEPTQEVISGLNHCFNSRKSYKNTELDIEYIVRGVVDAIYHLKPGAFKKSGNLLKAMSFMNGFYEEMEKYDKGEIYGLTCLQQKKAAKMKI